MDRRKFFKTVELTAGAALFSGLGLAGTTEMFNNKTNYKMEIVVLTGSPRRNGNTNYLAGQFIKGAEEAGHYFGFSAQLKTVIDRFYAINGQTKGVSKRSVLLMAYANTNPKEAEPMISHYHTLLHYLDWKDSGMVVASGMWPTGAVNNTEYSRRAYELGRNIK